MTRREKRRQRVVSGSYNANVIRCGRRLTYSEFIGKVASD